MKAEWIDNVNERNLNQFSYSFVAHLTVCDNVLDRLDWPIQVIFVDAYKVLRQEEIHNGVYDIPNFEGKKVSDVVRWINQNRDLRAEDHPQVLRELMFVKGGEHDI
jgi:hypothetical protein